MPLLTVHRTGRKKPVPIPVPNLETGVKIFEAFVYSLKRDPNGWVALTEGNTLIAHYPKLEPAEAAEAAEAPLAERMAA